jgi:hypothetical protein
MKTVARILGVLALGLAVAGCRIQHDDDSLSKVFGSSFVGAGGDINLTESIAGDAFLAGGNVSTASQVQGDLVAVGGEVSIGGSVGDDLYTAGGQIQVDAIISGNARVAGGAVTIGPATTIGGGLTVSGGRLRFEGTVHDRLEATGASVSLDGVVLGDAEVRAEQVEIGPNTRIDGKLVVHSSQEPVIPEGARIAGGIEFNPTDPGTAHETPAVAPEVRSVAHGVGSFLWMLGVFIAGTLFMLAFPGYSQRAAARIGSDPLKTLALGFVLLFCLPVLVVLLLITIIGIPLALLVLLLYLLLLFLGWVTAALFLSHKLLGVMRGGGQPSSTGWRMFALLLGVLGLWLLGQLPYVGGWVSFAALLLGIGALVWQGWPSRAAPSAPAAA